MQKNRILRQEQVAWRDLTWLQTDNLKVLSKPSMAKLKNSLGRHGFIQPFNVWDNGGQLYILDGHHRRTAMLELEDSGERQFPDTLPANVLDCKDRKEAVEFLLLYSSQYASVDKQGIADFIELEELDISLLSDEVDIPQWKLPEPEKEEELPEERAVATVSEDIQRVQVGRHTIYIGKFSVGCISGDPFDLCLTDPPYGINAGQMSGRKGSEFETETDKNGWRNFGNLDWDSEPVDRELLEYIRDISKNQIIWGGNYFADNLPASMGWLFWDKGQRNFSLADGELAWTSYKKALRVFEYSRAKANKQEKWHPTQKPVELMDWCLQWAGDGIKSVIDPFGGSGTTLLACEKAGIACTMFEQIPKHAEIAIRRLEELIGASTS